MGWMPKGSSSSLLGLSVDIDEPSDSSSAGSAAALASRSSPMALSDAKSCSSPCVTVLFGTLGGGAPGLGRIWNSMTSSLTLAASSKPGLRSSMSRRHACIMYMILLKNTGVSLCDIQQVPPVCKKTASSVEENQ